MKALHPKTIETIREIAIGGRAFGYRRYTKQLIPLLRSFGAQFDDPSAFTATQTFVDNLLYECNSSEWSDYGNNRKVLARMILALVDPREFEGSIDNQEGVLSRLNRTLKFEGLEVRLGPRRYPLLFDLDEQRIVIALNTQGEEIVSGEADQLRGLSDNRSVFIVHGHDIHLLNEVQLLLNDLEIEHTILQQEPSGGRTVIEKFESYADANYAIVLLSPDDYGKSLDADQWRTRARQNVILELGYFYGRLGRARVTAVHKKVEEIPSDIDGVLTVRWDELGSWKHELAREMQYAGLPVDLNKLSVR